MAQLSDEELIFACREGDRSAWEILVKRYERLIYAIPRRAGFDQDAAADVFQQVFLLLVKNLHRIKQPSQMQAWLVTTARRETLQMIRHRKREVLIGKSEESQENFLQEIPDEAALPDEVILKLETQNRVRVALGSLDERCQNLLKMLFYGDKPPAYTEIAAALGISEGSIGPTRARCLQKLLSFL